MADVRDLIIVFLSVCLLGLLIRGGGQATVRGRAVENEEKWTMWEDEEGKLHAEVHRRVMPSE